MKLALVTDRRTGAQLIVPSRMCSWDINQLMGADRWYRRPL